MPRFCRTEIELGIRRRVTILKCGCKYRAEDDAVVKSGHELGGYIISPCREHVSARALSSQADGDAK